MLVDKKILAGGVSMIVVGMILSGNSIGHDTNWSGGND